MSPDSGTHCAEPRVPTNMTNQVKINNWKADGNYTIIIKTNEHAQYHWGPRSNERLKTHRKMPSGDGG
jgi:hypothetical protein